MAWMVIMKHQKSEAAGSGSAPAISLRNEGDLDLFFLGSGSAFSKKFYQNNLLVVKGDKNVLIDCGSRAPEALSRLGHSVMDIGAFLITHSHADHIGGLEEAMLMNRYVGKKRGRMIITEKYERQLWSMSLRGGAAFNEEHGGEYLKFDDFWEALRPQHLRGSDREFATIKEGDIEFGLFRTKHIPDSAAGWEDSALSYGVLIDRRILFSSDTRHDPDLVMDMDREYGLEAIFQDCQFYKGGVHASLEELGEWPAGLKAKTWLMHYGDAVDKYRERAAELGFAGFVEEWATYRFAPKAALVAEGAPA
jgi:ribonuclease BN (tRNA processing enzyme)